MSDEIQDLSKPCVDSKANDKFKAQKGTKHIVKIVHVTSVVQPLFYNATRIFFFKLTQAEWKVGIFSIR